MSSLLVQSCSKTKNRPTEAVPALDLYSGYFFKIIKKAIREGEYDESIDLCILSAEHGIVENDERISWYDRRMDSTRAQELAPEVTAQLAEFTDSMYDKLLINAGDVYLEALQQAIEELTIPIYYIEGNGIGIKGSILKELIRGDIDVESKDEVVKMGEANVSA